MVRKKVTKTKVIDKVTNIAVNKPPKKGKLYWSVCANDELEARQRLDERYPGLVGKPVETFIYKLGDGRLKVYFDVEEHVKVKRHEELLKNV